MPLLVEKDRCKSLCDGMIGRWNEKKLLPQSQRRKKTEENARIKDNGEGMKEDNVKREELIPRRQKY